MSTPTELGSHVNFDQVGTVDRNTAASVFARMERYRDRGAVAQATAALDAALPPPPARLLDVGPGRGEDATLLAQAGYDVCGVDVRTDLAQVRGWTLLEGAAEALPVGDGLFDVVRANRVIHHLRDRMVFFDECRRVVHDRGLLLASWPDRSLTTTSDDRVTGLVRELTARPGLTANPARSGQVLIDLDRAGFDPQTLRLHRSREYGPDALDYALAHADALAETASSPSDADLLRAFIRDLRAGDGWVAVSVATVVATPAR